MSKSQISQIQGNPCPYCAGRKVLPGFNDLATQHPAIAKEWNTKRNSISAEEILWNSHKKVWWVCGKGHEWETAVYLRTQSHTGCPYCAGRKFLPGFNDLATQHPAIAKEWNTKRNGLVNAVGVAYEPNDR
jgi:predicted methyltransferase